MLRKLIGFTVLATVAILFAQIPSSTACMCMPQHSQTSYCNSDYGKWIRTFIRISNKSTLCFKFHEMQIHMTQCNLNYNWKQKERVRISYQSYTSFAYEMKGCCAFVWVDFSISPMQGNALSFDFHFRYCFLLFPQSFWREYCESRDAKSMKTMFTKLKLKKHTR